MLTRCPACQTVFRLRPEQLRARHGEVRCGHCFNPFNALEHLIEDGSDAAAPQPDAPPPAVEHTPFIEQPSAAAEPPAAPATGTSQADTSAFSDLEFDIPDDQPAALPAPTLEPGDTMPPPAAVEAALEPASGLDFDTAFDPWPHQLEPVVAPPPAEARAEPSIVQAASVDHAEPEIEAATAEPPEHSDPLTDAPRVDFSAMVAAAGSRLAGAQQAAPLPSEPPPVARAEPEAGPAAEEPAAPAPPQHDFAAEADTPPLPATDTPATDTPADSAHLDANYGPAPANGSLRSGLAGLGLAVLLIALLVQSAYLFRTSVARELPGLRPLYVATCAQIGCDMPLPRDAALINIDSPDLQSDPGRPGRYILHATIQNRADYPQAWPHLELTLTDNRDTPLVRRVLTPAEWLAPGKLQEGEFKARSDATVRLAFDAPEIAPTGYAVYVFYP